MRLILFVYVVFFIISLGCKTIKQQETGSNVNASSRSINKSDDIWLSVKANNYSDSITNILYHILQNKNRIILSDDQYASFKQKYFERSFYSMGGTSKKLPTPQELTKELVNRDSKLILFYLDGYVREDKEIIVFDSLNYAILKYPKPRNLLYQKMNLDTCVNKEVSYILSVLINRYF